MSRKEQLRQVRHKIRAQAHRVRALENKDGFQFMAEINKLEQLLKARRCLLRGERPPLLLGI